MLPAKIQRILWIGREKAKSIKQAIHWDTADNDMSPETVKRVYTDLYGQTRADAMLSIMARKRKEAEADRRLMEE